MVVTIEQKIVEDTLKRTDLSNWDKDFMLSLQEQIKSGKSLSEKQIVWVHKISSRYSDEAIKERSEWSERWTTDSVTRDLAKTCARFYTDSGYYQWSQNILTDESFVPSLKQFKALTENKYIVKVLDAYKAKPKYPAGSMVQIRKSLSGPDSRLMRRKMFELETDLAIVVSTNETIVSACNGNKRYKIVFLGDAVPMFAEERDLKKMPKNPQKSQDKNKS